LSPGIVTVYQNVYENVYHYSKSPNTCQVPKKDEAKSLFKSAHTAVSKTYSLETVPGKAHAKPRAKYTGPLLLSSVLDCHLDLIKEAFLQLETKVEQSHFLMYRKQVGS